jgi:hypothetical protein
MADADVLIASTEGLYVPGSDAPDAFGGRDVTALARGGGSLWAIVDGSDVWRRADGPWEQFASLGGTRAGCVLGLADGAYVGTSRAHLLWVGGEGAEQLESFEQIESRNEWYTPWGGPPDVRSLSSSASGLYANVHVGGILHSEDDGKSWHPTIDIHADVHQVVSLDDTILAATARGLATSTDRGESWDFATTGLHADYCRAVAVCDGDVLLSASISPHGGRAAVYRLAGSRFEKCTEGLPDWFGDNIDTHCLAGAGAAAAFATSDGFVFTSSDRGRNWRLAAEGLPPVRAVVIDASTPRG